MVIIQDSTNCQSRQLIIALPHSAVCVGVVIIQTELFPKAGKKKWCSQKLDLKIAERIMTAFSETGQSIRFEMIALDFTLLSNADGHLEN